MNPPTRNKFAVAALVVAAIAALGVGIANAVDDDSPDRALTGEDLDRATEAALAETGGGRVTDSEADDGGYEVEVTLDDGREVDVHLDGDFNVLAADPDDRDDPDDDADERDDRDDADDRPLTGRTLERATEAALAEAGGGRVTDTEADDGGYDIEVTFDDGRQLDVHLDRDFDVVSSEPDDD